jgi:primosomal protein N' (replication factor Y)
MQFVEVIVNVPIRRTFGRAGTAPAAPDTATEAGPEADDALQIYHYHLPPEMEHQVQPGHLVWAPFGHQEVQGVVARLADSAPLTTRPLLRLARPEPVLTAAQLNLARWIAQEYVAPVSEAVKLFLPPGLLAKEDRAATARVRREWQVALALPLTEARVRLLTLGRANAQVQVLQHLLAAPELRAAQDELATAYGAAAKNAVRALAKQERVAVAEGEVTLLLTPAAAEDLVLTLRGADKHLPLLEALVATGEEAVWKNDLPVQAPLAQWRDLRDAGLVTLREETRFRDPLAARTYRATAPPVLTAEQEQVWRVLEKGPLANRGLAYPRPVLLFGVTGSGKTEIYLRAIAATLAQGRQVIALVPEIALTPQTIARFAGRFPGRVTVIHSGLSQGERYDVWRALRDGRFDIVVGPRSALFAPLPRPGLIIIDEEHDAAYKQDAEAWGSFKVFYDARAVARRLAAQTSSLLILGSATPSLESYFAAEQGDLQLLSLPQRVMGHGGGTDGPAYADLPPVEVVDMRQELRAGNRSLFSRSLSAELRATLDAGEQAILFLNRRGTNTIVMCRDCGHIESCTRCNIPLTFHGDEAQLVCHHCNRRYPVPAICPACSSKRIKHFGAGTERIAASLAEIAPDARILRWDADTAARRGAHETIMAQFAAHEADVLIGTQMIAKGLDLPLVTLVGVVAADVGLYLPDFRSGERTFQLLTQVAGRAGRSARGGRVVIQTYRPEHHAIQAAAQHDYLAFYRRELAFRQELGYPPFGRLARLIYWEKNERKARAAAAEMADVLRHRVAVLGMPKELATILGPMPAFFGRIRGFYRWQIVLRTPDPPAFLRGVDIPFGWRLDIDPVSML